MITSHLEVLMDHQSLEALTDHLSTWPRKGWEVKGDILRPFLCDCVSYRTTQVLPQYS